MGNRIGVLCHIGVASSEGVRSDRVGAGMLHLRASVLVSDILAPCLLRPLRLTFPYPNPTSRTIITVNPIMVPMVARSPFPPCCASGMTSSTTTKIIAPAAKARA